MSAPAQSNHQQQCSTRQLPFASIKPPFHDSVDYHRFDGRVEVDQETDAIVVQSSIMKRKTILASSNQTYSKIYTGVNKSPLKTPMSTKGRRVYNRKGYKGNKAASQTPISAGNSRYERSLALVLSTKKFINLINRSEDGILELNKAVATLKVKQRRIYDITNVLEGAGLIEKKLRNRIRWKGLDVSQPGGVEADVSSLQTDVENLNFEEQHLDDSIREMQERLRDLSEDENNQKLLFVTEDDIKSLPCFQNQTLIAIKAPHGTTLEVPDPDEAADYTQRRYRIVLRSTMGPIDLYLVSSQFEKKLEDANGVEQSANCPVASTSRFDDTHRMASDQQINASASDDFVGGIMKLVPDANIDTDHWFLSDADLSVTELWHSDCIPYGMEDTGIPQPQTPPSGVSVTELNSEVIYSPQMIER